MRRFGLKTGIVFEGATVAYEHICRMVPNEYEITPQLVCEFKMNFGKSFCRRSNLSNDDIISVFVNMMRFAISSRSENGCGK